MYYTLEVNIAFTFGGLVTRKSMNIVSGAAYVGILFKCIVHYTCGACDVFFHIYDLHQ